MGINLLEGNTGYGRQFLDVLTFKVLVKEVGAKRWGGGEINGKFNGLLFNKTTLRRYLSTPFEVNVYNGVILFRISL